MEPSKNPTAPTTSGTPSAARPSLLARLWSAIRSLFRRDEARVKAEAEKLEALAEAEAAKVEKSAEVDVQDVTAWLLGNRKK